MRIRLFPKIMVVLTHVQGLWTLATFEEGGFGEDVFFHFAGITEN